MLLAKPLDQSAAGELGGNLLDATHRGGDVRRAAFRRIAKAHALAGIDEQQGPRVFDQLSLGPFLEAKEVKQDAGECEQAQPAEQNRQGPRKLDASLAVQ